MEFRNLNKTYALIGIGMIALATILSAISLLHSFFGILWDAMNINVLVVLLFLCVFSLTFAHLEWHAQQDEKGGEKHEE